MTPRLCSYADCGRLGTEFDDVERWAFCRPHYREHLALMAEERGRKCARCDTYFHSDVTQRRHCDACRQTRDTRPSYKQRARGQAVDALGTTQPRYGGRRSESVEDPAELGFTS